MITAAMDTGGAGLKPTPSPTKGGFEIQTDASVGDERWRRIQPTPPSGTVTDDPRESWSPNSESRCILWGAMRDISLPCAST